MDGHTGIRQMIVDIAKESMVQTSIQEGIVKSLDPLKIGLTEDKKIELSKNSLIVPARFKDKLEKGDRLYLLVAGGGGQYYVLDKA